MSCSCNKNEIIKNEKLNLYYISQTLPFDICPLCAFKHISYALIKFENKEYHRMIANIYLAYKHLNKYFIQQSKAVFNLIVLFFENNLNKQQLLNIVEILHNLAIKFKTIQNKFIELEKPISIEKQLISKKQYIYLNLVIINELFNFEIGYKDINTPYCIGLLQQCTQYEDTDIWKNRIRGFWKSIQSDKILNSQQILNFAEDFLYRSEKDKNN